MVTVNQIKKHKRLLDQANKEARQIWRGRCVAAFITGLFIGLSVTAVLIK